MPKLIIYLDMIIPLRQVNPKTKILFFTLVFILIPGAVLSYLGLRSIDKNVESLRTNFVGTINLVCDKLEREVINQEEGLLNNLINLYPELKSQTELQMWLRDIQEENPAIDYPFFLYTDGGFISSDISFSKNKSSESQTGIFLEEISDFKIAEEAEFIKKDYFKAIQYYKKLLGADITLKERVQLHSRIGRCYYKAGKINKGIEEYRKILKVNDDNIIIGTVPSSVAALSQISDGYKVLNNAETYNNSLIELYERVLYNPWDLDGGGYLYYLKSAIEDVKSMLDSDYENKQSERNINQLINKGRELLDQIRFVDLYKQRIFSEIVSGPNTEAYSELKPQHISFMENNISHQLGYFKLPPAFQKSRVLALCYKIEKDYILSHLLPEVLTAVELGSDVLIGILDENENLLYLREDLQISNYLAAKNFSQLFVSWKVAMFDRSGNTIEELAGKEKRFYFGLFAGIIFIMAVGIFFTVRAVIHESEVSRIKSDFVSSVSHELKTPLSLIRMFGETLETGIVTDENKRQEFYSIIRKESERLTHLINNVLDFSKMDAGIKEYNFIEADLIKIIRSSLEAYKFHIRDLGFEIKSKMPSETIMVRIDEDAISQAFLNLLSNAVKYSKEKKYILVQVWKDIDSAVISVEDHGVGIPIKEQKKIFDKFYRVSAPETTEALGSGLGLTLAKHIAEAHGGTIEVESEVGKGSIFTIRIPI